MSFSLIYYVDNVSHFTPGTVTNLAPFTVETASAVSFAAGQRVLLAFTEDDNCFKANAQVSSVNGSSVALTELDWDSADRRRFPRYPVNASINVRAVAATENGYEIKPWEGETQDLSLGGAWLSVPTPVAPGFLVQVEVKLTPTQSVQALGIVARTPEDNEGFGIQFIDFVGGSRYYLHEFLSQRAA